MDLGCQKAGSCKAGTIKHGKRENGKSRSRLCYQKKVHKLDAKRDPTPGLDRKENEAKTIRKPGSRLKQKDDRQNKQKH